jgi:hypothetical protein
MIVLLEKWLREWRPKQNSRGRGNAWIFMAFARLAAAETNSTQARTQNGSDFYRPTRARSLRGHHFIATLEMAQKRLSSPRTIWL